MIALDKPLYSATRDISRQAGSFCCVAHGSLQLTHLPRADLGRCHPVCRVVLLRLNEHFNSHSGRDYTGPYEVPQCQLELSSWHCRLVSIHFKRCRRPTHFATISTCQTTPAHQHTSTMHF